MTEPLPAPLEEFFWRADETGPALPDLGLGARDGTPAAAPAGAAREVVAFALGDEEYGLPIHAVREILRAPTLAEVPRAPAHVLGVATVRGEIVPVVDPRRRLALPAAPAVPRARVVVCETGDGPVGLLVDRVTEVFRLPLAAIEPRPPGLSGPGAEPIGGIGRQGDRLVILLDLAALLGTAVPPPPEGEEAP